MSHIRAIAICLFRRDDRILAFEGRDSIKGETYYRPLGGGIEFGPGRDILFPDDLLEMLR